MWSQKCQLYNATTAVFFQITCMDRLDVVTEVSVIQCDNCCIFYLAFDFHLKFWYYLALGLVVSCSMRH